jgi:hypothetical protein
MPAAEVLVWVRYNGHLHECVGFKGAVLPSGQVEVHVLQSQLPKAYHAEHGTHQFTFAVEPGDLAPREAGGWVIRELVDLDSF